MLSFLASRADLICAGHAITIRVSGLMQGGNRGDFAGRVKSRFVFFIKRVLIIFIGDSPA
ncbi:hypothetical protein [Burkholderia pyrrocinia]|uniref:hypothetical protein n=1 Tax=Burkholderia pyrrocinia TaxID=60550 RepID=UPI002AB273A0|nr:hypothetical protein [Burkholderia pyrrocinia]